MSYRKRSEERSRYERKDDHSIDDDDEQSVLKHKLKKLTNFQLNFKRATLIQTVQIEEMSNTPKFKKQKTRARTHFSTQTNTLKLFTEAIDSIDSSSSNDDINLEAELEEQEVNVRAHILSRYKDSFFNEKIKDFNERKSSGSPTSKKKLRALKHEPMKIEKLPSYPSSLSGTSNILSGDHKTTSHYDNVQSQQSAERRSDKSGKSLSRFSMRQHDPQHNQLYSVEFRPNQTPSAHNCSNNLIQVSSKTRLVPSDLSVQMHPNSTKSVSLLQNRVSDDVEQIINQPQGDDSPVRNQYPLNLNDAIRPIPIHKEMLVQVQSKRSTQMSQNLFQVPNVFPVNNPSSRNKIEQIVSQNIISQQDSNYTIDFPMSDSINSHKSSVKTLDIYSDDELVYNLIHLIYKKNTIEIRDLLIVMQREYRNDILNFKDFRGNTPFFLAIKLAYQSSEYFEIAKLFLQHGAEPHLKDDQDWAPIEETVAQMDIQSTSLVFDYLVNNKQVEFQKNRYVVDQELTNIEDFYLEIKWEFRSTIIPFFSKMAPSDVFKLHKKGTSLRLDQTFAGLKNFKTKRRDISLIYNPYELDKQRKENQRDCQYIVVINKSKKHYFYPLQQIDTEEKRQILFDLLNCDNVSGQMKFSDCKLQRSKNIFGNFVDTQIGDWSTQKYDFKFNIDQQFQKKNHRPLLLTYDQYISTNYTATKIEDQTSRFHFQKIGNLIEPSKSTRRTDSHREQKLDSKNQAKTCAIFLSDKFPLRFDKFMPIIRLLAKGNHLMQSLEQLLQEEQIQKLLISDGFPVRVEIPISFSIEAIVTFQGYRKLEDDNSQTSLFQIPENTKYIHRKLAQKTMETEKKRLLLANLFL